MPEHETVPLASPNGNTVQIDTLIAPLVQTLWDLGINTINSCQEVGHSKWLGEPYAWVGIYPTSHFNRLYQDFLSKVYPSQEFSRISCTSLFGVFKQEQFRPRLVQEKNWFYQMTCQREAGNFYFSAELYFPQEEIPDLVDKLQTLCP